MTYDDKRLWLLRYLNINELIDKKLEQRERTRIAAFKITPTISDIPKSLDGGNKIQDIFDQVAEMDREIDELIDRKNDIKDEIVRAAIKLGDVSLYKVIIFKYILDYPWGLIAKKIDRGVENTRSYLHIKAIKLLDIV